MLKQAISHLKRLHQIPCNKCAYFTGDYRLKCTVNPIDAMSENAIGCRDFMHGDHHVCRSYLMTKNNKSKHKLFLNKSTTSRF